MEEKANVMILLCQEKPQNKKNLEIHFIAQNRKSSLKIQISLDKAKTIFCNCRRDILFILDKNSKYTRTT